ncbi:MAG: hypothetical protein NVS4B1_22030 [Ktedonobacteraceae bacterium]
MPNLDLNIQQDYTRHMRQRRVFLLLLFMLAGLTASCSAGHLGSNELAFIRNGQLWTIDPNGANAFSLVAQDTPVVGYSWSPTHQILVLRTLDPSFVKTSASKHLATNTITGQVEDSPSTVNTIGVDGGSPIPIMLSSPDVQYSNPIWNTTGTRLLYRQEPTGTYIPGNTFWWASQNDQPQGIAAKLLPTSDARLSPSYIDSSAIGITKKGIFTVELTGANTRFLVHGPLQGHPLPAALERVLWQPQHAQPSLLYARLAPSKTTQPTTSKISGPIPEIQLMLHTSDRQEKVVVTCTCVQFAWSPDGNTILYSTGGKDTLFNIATHTSFDMPVERSSVPYWSPDSKFLLLDGTHTLQLVRIADHQQQVLLSDGVTSDAGTTIAGVHALLQPAPNSLWASDSHHFLFLTHNRLLWRGHTLSSGKGLYTVTIDAHGQPQAMPGVVDTGNDTQAGWTNQDENTSFLY